MSPPEGPPPSPVARFNWDNAQRGLTGVCYVKSEIGAAITDGLSKTLLVGEENLNPEHYETGIPLNDNQGAYTGFNYDNNRVANRQYPPGPDTFGQNRLAAFGSAHFDRLERGILRRLRGLLVLRFGPCHCQPPCQPQRQRTSNEAKLNARFHAKAPRRKDRRN